MSTSVRCVFRVLSTSSTSKFDPIGISLHTGLWASLVSSCAGASQSWWWDGWLVPLWPIYAPVAEAIAFLQRSSSSVSINCTTSGNGAALAYGVAGSARADRAIVWVRNALWTWNNVFQVSAAQWS